MKDILQGKSFRHPLHPFLVHFPIALFSLALLLEIAAQIWPQVSGLREGAFYTIVTGVVMALIAAVPGFVDFSDIRRDHPARKIAVTHMLLNLLVVGIYAAAAGVHWNEARTNLRSILPLIITGIGFVLLGISGHLGGKLVFDNGISVGRHRRKTRSPEETVRIGTGATKAANEPVVVAKANELGEGETMRVELNGVVLAVARLDGEVYAFQEFCTHRFGPLSEGCLKGGEVECPWHRSRFNMRTGEVTHGPAKEPLRVFEAKIVDGNIVLLMPQSPAPAQ